MKDRTSDKFWFPWWPDKWIFGSVRIEFNPAERGIWVDLLSLASKDNGHIRANEETPYPIQQLSGMLLIPEKELSAAIEKFIKTKDQDGNGKLTRTKAGTLYVTKWEKYQFGDRHKRRIEQEMESIESREEKIFNKSAMKCPPEFIDMANKSGAVRMPRLIMAIIIGRSLKKEEEVHHINKKDNDHRPENLMLFANHADHGRHEYGYEIEPIWDGSKMGMAEKTATTAKINASILDNNTEYNSIEHKKTEIFNKEFESFWKFYRSIGDPKDDIGSKPEARKAYKALRRRIPKKEIAEAAHGESDYLKYKRLDKNFTQSKKFASTWLRSNRWQEHKDFKYSAKL